MKKETQLGVFVVVGWGLLMATAVIWGGWLGFALVIFAMLVTAAAVSGIRIGNAINKTIRRIEKE